MCLDHQIRREIRRATRPYMDITVERRLAGTVRFFICFNTTTRAIIMQTAVKDTLPRFLMLCT